MPETSKRRAVASNVALTIANSLVQLQVDLLSARPTDKTDFTSICPDCPEPHAVSERYICNEDAEHGPYTRTELAKGREIDKVLYAVSPEDVQASAAPTMTKDDAVLVRVFPSASVNAHVRPTGTSYLLRPVGKTVAAYAAFAEMVADPKLAFLCEVMVRNGQKLYRIEAWNGQLALQELVRPNELAATEPVVLKTDKAAKAMLQQIIQNGMEEFNADDFRWVRPEHVAALDERLVSSGGGAVVPTKGKKSTTGGEDLMALLQASLEQANMGGDKVTSIKKAKSPKKKAS